MRNKVGIIQHKRMMQDMAPLVKLRSEVPFSITSKNIQDMELELWLMIKRKNNMFLKENQVS